MYVVVCVYVMDGWVCMYSHNYYLASGDRWNISGRIKRCGYVLVCKA